MSEYLNALNILRSGSENLIASEFKAIDTSDFNFKYPDLNVKPLQMSSLATLPPDSAEQPVPITTESHNLDVSFEELLKQEGVNARITSGYREGSKTKQGRSSNHSRKDESGNSMAYDVVPNDGDFEKLRSEIYNNPRIVAWLQKNAWGALEETTPEVMKKTGATGKHWHFGPDTAAKKDSEKNGVVYNQLGGTIGLLKKIKPIEFLNLQLLQPVKEVVWKPTEKFLDNLSNTDNKLEFNDSEFTNNKDYQEMLRVLNLTNFSEEKKEILLKIAKLESSFDHTKRAKGSTASGLFGFLDSTKKAYGYGNSVSSQIMGASKLYDYLEESVNNLVTRYGDRGKSKEELIYGAWFRPASLRNYLKTGSDSFRDAHGTTINTIFRKIKELETNK